MVGDITATIHPKHFDATLFELGFTPQQVGSLTSPPKGEGVRMLKQQQGGGNLSSRDLYRQAGPVNPRLAGRAPNPNNGPGMAA